ncbi:MAG: hypothetical protein HOV71_02950 [Hamadaea sp.]|uniref:hypothetical protein n=1 Tax=Hamadaea sp. NPDC050747 TaxID=3155789 RepID=UPI0018519F48|nr:hypothetical protein [Hamadaea sp.]NUR47072.1 hypothetical protein [Hamadaea sp.]NUT05520.1 hypothetical protein [Hamadaea sp.]
MSNTRKAGNSKNHHKPDELAFDLDLRDPSDDHGYAGEQAREESRQAAMAAREKSMRTKMSVGQANTMRLKRGNQPRGGR